MSVSESKREVVRSLLRDLEDRVLELMCDSHEKGKRWESDVAELANSRGLVVEPSDGRGDMKINGLVVQCKHIDAIRSGETLDVSNMRPVNANDGHRGYVVGEYDVLALKHRDGVYLIPAQWMDTGNGTLAGSVRISHIQQFRNDWCVFDGNYVPPRRDEQLSIDF